MCAPTGAGKTNIAMITVLREVAAHMVHGVIQKDAFKVNAYMELYKHVDAVAATWTSV